MSAHISMPLYLTCPTCSTQFHPQDRCSARGLGRCMERAGHGGWHWTDVGDGGVWRWTGLYSVKSCPARLDLADWCVKPSGHAGSHNNGRGTTFSPDVAEALTPSPQETEPRG